VLLITLFKKLGRDKKELI